MTKDEFKLVINQLIRAFNENHSQDVVVVLVDCASDRAEIFSHACGYHMAMASAALANATAKLIHNAAHAEGFSTVHEDEDIATQILRDASFNGREGS